MARPLIFAVLGNLVIIEIIEEEEPITMDPLVIKVVVKVLSAIADAWMGKAVGEIAVPIVVGLLASRWWLEFSLLQSSC